MYESERASVSSLVSFVVMTSTSCIFSTGEKKCRPMKFFGAWLTFARSVIGMADVLLAHTPFFKAGIAGDGNYNRTLTTMSFQTERRQIWDARETYLEMSPLLWANRVHGALLMYHGMDDANVGTNPINAEHMFMALDGLGKPAALYMYPYEGHGPLAKETTLDLWARWVAWLEMYVKNPKKDMGAATSEQR